LIFFLACFPPTLLALPKGGIHTLLAVPIRQSKLLVSETAILWGGSWFQMLGGKMKGDGGSTSISPLVSFTLGAAMATVCVLFFMSASPGNRLVDVAAWSRNNGTAAAQLEHLRSVADDTAVAASDAARNVTALAAPAPAPAKVRSKSILSPCLLDYPYQTWGLIKMISEDYYCSIINTVPRTDSSSPTADLPQANVLLTQVLVSPSQLP
jgi:hypothetical protein